jgi:hypothetical protein
MAKETIAKGEEISEDLETPEEAAIFDCDFPEGEEEDLEIDIGED